MRITALLFFQRRYRRPEFIASIELLMRRFLVLHARMQRFFNAWDRADATPYGAAALNVMHVAFLRRLQAELGDPPMADDDLRRRLDANYALLEACARSWQAIAAEQDPALARFVADSAEDDSAVKHDMAPLRLTPSRVPV